VEYLELLFADDFGQGHLKGGLDPFLESGVGNQIRQPFAEILQMM